MEKLSGTHERYEVPIFLPIPVGTIKYARSEDEQAADTFGVREILQTSSDGTLLVRYAKDTQSLGDTKVRLQAQTLSADNLNKIGETIGRLLEAFAQVESIPKISEPVLRLEQELRRLNRPQILASYSSDIQDVGVRQAIQQLGIISEELHQAEPRKLGELIQCLKALHELGVVYFVADGNTIPVDQNISYFARRLEQLETA